MLGSDDYNYYSERVGLNIVTADREILDSHCEEEEAAGDVEGGFVESYCC